MLNLGLYFLRVVGHFKIYTELVTWKFSQNYHVFDLTLYIYLCILLTSLSDCVMFLHYDSFRVHSIIGDSSPFSKPPRREINIHVLRSQHHNIQCIFGVTVCENISNEFQIQFESHFLLLETLLDRNKLNSSLSCRTQFAKRTLDIRASCEDRKSVVQMGFKRGDESPIIECTRNESE